MIIKLQPEQISSLWDIIKYAIIRANDLQEHNAQGILNNVLTDLLSGKAQVWVAVDRGGETGVLYAVGVTCVMTDPLGSDYLLVHSFFSYRTITLDMSYEALRLFEQYARENGCKRLVANTTDPELPKLFTHLGLRQAMFVYSKDL